MVSPCGEELPHIQCPRFNEHSIMDDPIHDGVRMDAPSQPTVPVLASKLCAENRGGGIIAAFDELKEKMLLGFRGLFQKPFIENEQGVNISV